MVGVVVVTVAIVIIIIILENEHSSQIVNLIVFVIHQ